MRLAGAALELGVGLAGDEKGMVGQLDHLHQALVGGEARNHEAAFHKRVAVGVVHLEAMAMALVNDGLAVGPCRAGAGHHLAGVGAQAHGAALVFHVLLLGHEVNDEGRARGRRVGEFGGSGAVQAARVAGKRADGRLQPQADAQKRHVVLAGVAGRGDLALEGAGAEAAGHEDAVHAAEHRISVLVGELLAVDEVHVHMAPRRDAGGHECLVDGEVGVGQAHVLAHHGDVQLAGAGVLRLQEGTPGSELDFAGRESHLRQGRDVETLLVEADGHLVDGRRVGAGEHVVSVHVAEQRDFLAHPIGDLMIGPAHDEVRLHA